MTWRQRFGFGFESDAILHNPFNAMAL